MNSTLNAKNGAKRQVRFGKVVLIRVLQWQEKTASLAQSASKIKIRVICGIPSIVLRACCG